VIIGRESGRANESRTRQQARRAGHHRDRPAPDPVLRTAATHRGLALGAVGSVLGNPWVITAAIVLVFGVVLWRVRRSATTTRNEQCCPPRPPTSVHRPGRLWLAPHGHTGPGGLST
jgi:hypothetical protein